MTDLQDGTAPAPTTLTCPVCEQRGEHRRHRAEEKMFGRNEAFTYLECAGCGSLALQNVPPLAGYYPPEYYSLVDRSEPDAAEASRARSAAMALLLRSRRVAPAMVACGGVLGIHVQPWVQLLGGSRLDLESRVLDVGCGDGHRLQTLRRFGFSHLTGIDPHLVSEVEGTDAMVLSRKGLDELDEVFDIIMFHHSFEHLADPAGVLGEVHRLLAPHGLLLLRIPLAGSWAWRTYGVDWVQLDAPRHLFLYTPKGLSALATRTGFDHRRTVYDSGPFQFWGSELYRSGTALRDSGSVNGAPPPTVSRVQIEQWERQATRLNAAGDGDQAAFLFTKAAEPGPTSGR